MRILITGDSSTSALISANKKREENPLIQIEIRNLDKGAELKKPFFYEEDGEICFHSPKKFFPEQKFFASLEYIPDAVGVCGPMNSTLWRDRDWARFVPAELAEEEYPVSDALLKEVVRFQSMMTIEFVKTLKKYIKHVFVIEAPRPFNYHQAFERSRYEVIKYVDSFYRESVAQMLNEIKVPVITVPEDTCDEDGFMLYEFRNGANDGKGDAVHAGPKFGDKMLDKITEHAVQVFGLY